MKLKRVGTANSLNAMYFLAAVAMAVAALLVVALMFLPPDLLSRGGQRWVPGEATPYDGPSQPTPPDPEQDEELHIH